MPGCLENQMECPTVFRRTDAEWLKPVPALGTLTYAIAKSAIAREQRSVEKPAQNSRIRCGWRCENLEWNAAARRIP